MSETDREPERRGDRAAAYLERYMARRPGLTVGELAFSLQVDKRDLRRLLAERSIGWRLDERLAAYFGDDFVEAMYRPVIGSEGSQRLRELDRERAEICAREARLASRRAAAHSPEPAESGQLWLVPVEAGPGPAPSRRKG